MNKNILRSFLAMGALATACASWGCVADRPARNGVYNENQYLRKDFLIRPGTAGATDPGWIFRSTILATSAPNPLAPLGLFVGADNSGGDSAAPGINYVRFAVTQDKLEMINMRELEVDDSAQGALDNEVVNAWPITNVDLKYRVNLDGETSNFYEENQELDWEVRQWVKLQWDKNDMSDLAPLGVSAQSVIAACTDSGNISTTLVPNSFVVDETNNYMSWQIQLTAPVLFSTQACVDAYGSTGITFSEFGRQDVTLTLEYSLTRAATDSGIARTPETPSTYVPLALTEKDPIRRKYGVFESIVWNRDPNTGDLAAQELLNRYNPNADYMDWYLAEGYPEQYMAMWTNPGGIVDQTNQLFADANAHVRMRVWNYDDQTDGCASGTCAFGNHGNAVPKLFGDVRYNFVHWVSDLDVADGPGFAGFTPSLNDPRTGERISTVINMADFPIYDYYVTKLDYYLQTIGAEQTLNAQGEWPPMSNACVVGDTFPLGGLSGTALTAATAAQQAQIASGHNEISTVYDRMQLYLHKPSTTYGYLNPSDFIPQESADFYNAFFKILPYEVYRDPATNPFVIPEGNADYFSAGGALQMSDYATRAQWHSMMSVIDHGYSPYQSNDSLGYTAPANSYDGTGGTNDVAAAAQFTGNLQNLRTTVFNQQYTQDLSRYGRVMDVSDIQTNFKLFEKDSRHCVWNNPAHTVSAAPACAGGGSGTTHWECRSEYLDSLVTSYWTQTVWHEFGHAVGLRHNFLSSIDKNNFPTWTDTNGTQHTGLYASSLMEYNSTPDRLFFAGGAAQNNANGGPWANGGAAGASQSTAAAAGNAPTHNGNWNGLPGWAPYDIAAVSFIYGNNRTPYAANPTNLAVPGAVLNGGKADIGPVPGAQNLAAVSGQISATAPWNDPNGWNTQTNAETPYLFCTDEDLRYSPFCRQGDFGTTPSEIIASAIDDYEWNYKWRNFRLYHKFWDDGSYPDTINAFFSDLTRFLSTWDFDWNGGSLAENFPKVGVVPPASSPLANYYGSLGLDFDNDISVANQLVASFHEAIIQQSSGERPFVTTYDPYYGDVVQQGIIIDKIIALQNWTSLNEITNYDPTQSAGAYLFAATPFDAAYQSVAEATLNTMIGGGYDVFSYVSPLSIQLFAQASHDINFTGRIEMRDWIGGYVFGGPEIDCNQPFLDFFHNLAQQSNATQVDATVFPGCVAQTPLNDCLWDPRVPQTDANDVYHSDPYNEFRGPDGRRYAWALLRDRNQIVVVDRDRNTGSYITVRNFNQDLVASHDDGTDGTYQLELPIKYTLDYFDAYN